MPKTVKHRVKQRNQEVSLFGINDCNKPRKNSKKEYKFAKLQLNNSKKKYTVKNRSIKEGPSKFKNIILFPNMLGQTKPGVDKAPAQLVKFINKKHHTITSLKLTNNLFKNIQILYKANARIPGRKVNIGGDHSMSIATIADTLNRYPNAKVIYFDAHGDINTYKSSNSKHYHGMPLSFLIGLGHDPHFSFIKNKLTYDNLLYIGSRCLDQFEKDIIYKNNIRYISPDEINTNFNNVVAKIDDFIKDSPVHLSYDVDSIDPKYIPSTGTTVKHGITMTSGINILDYLYGKNVVNVDITELNVELGSAADVKKSTDNTVLLFKQYLQ